MTFQDYFRQTSHPMVNLLLVLPLAILYGVGVVFVDPRAMNGADFITLQLLSLLGRSGLLVLYLLLSLAFVGLVYQRERSEKSQGGFERKVFVFILLESFVYALLLGEITQQVLWQIGLLGPNNQIAQWPMPTRFLLSLGAGVNEELVFRLGMIGGFLALLKRLAPEREGSILFALILISSMLFSLAHFTAETPTFFLFSYRFVAGILFALLYVFRGFAVAVYTHALYDIWVLLFL